jgi:hypothetical protein
MKTTIEIALELKPMKSDSNCTRVDCIFLVTDLGGGKVGLWIKDRIWKRDVKHDGES